MKEFSIIRGWLDEHAVPDFFNEETAPWWLKGDGKGSTVDNRWFWDDHVMKLEVGESVETDFSTITRMK